MHSSPAVDVAQQTSSGMHSKPALVWHSVCASDQQWCGIDGDSYCMPQGAARSAAFNLDDRQPSACI